MKAEFRAAGWLCAIVALALAGSAVASSFAAGQTFYDAYTQTPYSVAYRLPIHVVQAASPGWDVLLTAWLMLAAIALCGARLVRALREVRSGSAAWLLGAFAVACLALSTFSIIQSSDVYFYVLYGRLYGVYGVNPYVLGSKLSAASDPLIAQLLPFSGNPPFSDPYGPLWTLGAGLQSKLLAGADLFWSAWSFRAASIAAAIAAAAGVLHACRRQDAGARIGAAGRFAFHPLVLYECAVGGHNDAVMLAPAIWAFAIVDELPLVGGLLLGAAIAVKYVAAIALPFFVVRARRGGAFAPPIAAVLALAIPVLCAHPFQAGTAGSQALASNGSRFAMSIEWLVNMPIFAAGLGNVPALGWLPPLPLLGSPSWARIVELGALAIAAGVVAYGTWRCVRGRFDDKYVWRSVAALLMALPSMHPWYGLWIVPAAAGEGRWAAYAWWFGVLVLGCYTVDAVAAGSMPSWLPIAATVVYLALPVVIARFGRPAPTNAIEHGAG